MSVCTMKKLTVLAYAEDADAIVRKLMNLRCVEILTTEARHGLVSVDAAAIEAERRAAEERLAAIRRAIPILGRYTRRRQGLRRVVHAVNRRAFAADGREEAAWRCVCDTLEQDRQMQELQAELTRTGDLLQSLTPWLGYDAELGESETRHTRRVLGSLPEGGDPDAFAKALEAVGAYPEEITEEASGIYYAVTYHKRDEAAAESTLRENGFSSLSFPELRETARMAHERAEEALERMENQLLAAEEALRDLSESLDDVEILCDIVATTVTVCHQKRRLAATRNCVILQGWIPNFAEDDLSVALSGFTCAVEIVEKRPGEAPPVLLKNNAFARNFEWVLGMYSYPKYGTFDPTWIMSLFYFVIFGLMFADVGYGLLLVLACFGGIRLLNPKPGLRRAMMMFGLCGISCAVMGVIFGGWFGDLPIAIMKMAGLPTDTPVANFFKGVWFNPLDNVMGFLIFALAVGAVHLIAGMAINFYVLCRDHRAAEACCTILPYWVLFAGAGLLLVNTTVAAIVAGIGALMILLLNGYGQKRLIPRLIKGLGGLYGLISYLSDLLSYSRILALGLVAGVIAMVINLITPLGNTGVVGFIFMLIVLIVGHLLNIAINLLGTFIHASRLQYLEFFGKFFEDGGVPFDPALPTEEYSEECE